MSDLLLPANGWKPRDYQLPAWGAVERGIKRHALCWHRRAGKDDFALHRTAIGAWERIGNYWHMLPLANQARKAIWEAVNPHTGQRRIDEAFPKSLRTSTRDNDMFIRFKNGSTWQVFGSDNYETGIGSPPIGVIFSEYSRADPDAWAFLRPILAENGGWAMFISTPIGRNHFTKLTDYAITNPDDWYGEVLTVDDTKAIPPEMIERERRELTDERGEKWAEAFIRQEYHCDPDAEMAEGVVIPAAWVRSATNACSKLGIKPSGEKRAAFDVADEGKDKCAFAGRHGVELQHLDQWHGKDSDVFDSVEKVFALCDAGGYDRFFYDADGLGAGVRGDARVINSRRSHKIEVDEFRGSGEVMEKDSPAETAGEAKPGQRDPRDAKPRTNGDLFKNFKAQAWWALRYRFMLTHRAVEAVAAGETHDVDLDKIISLSPSLEHFDQLVSELSRPTWDDPGGKILIDKTPEGSASPNLADAVMMCYAPKPRRRGGFLTR